MSRLLEKIAVEGKPALIQKGRGLTPENKAAIEAKKKRMKQMRGRSTQQAVTNILDKQSSVREAVAAYFGKESMPRPDPVALAAKKQKMRQMMTPKAPALPAAKPVSWIGGKVKVNPALEKQSARQKIAGYWQEKVAQDPIVSEEGYALMDPKRPRISKGMGTGSWIGAVTGGGLGAGAGAGAGALLGGDYKTRLIAALLGGTTGAGAGALQGAGLGALINQWRQDAFDKRQRSELGLPTG